MWLLLGHIDARAQHWTKHTYATDRFEVEFPGDVRIVPTDLPPEFRERILRAVQFDAMSCKVVTRDTPLDGTTGRGRELRGTECIDGTHRVEARFFQAGHGFYQVIALFPTDGGDEAAARRFVQSFRLIGNR